MCAVLATSSKPLPSPPVTVSQRSQAELEPRGAQKRGQEHNSRD